MINSLLNEVTLTNIDFVKAQVQSYKAYYESLPEWIKKDNFSANDLLGKQHLGIKELNFKLFVKPAPRNFFSRVSHAFRVLSGKGHGEFVSFQSDLFTHTETPQGVEVSIQIEAQEGQGFRYSIEPDHVDPEKIVKL